MATLGLNGKVTLMDIAQATDPTGKIADVAELLTQDNEILLDMPWMEGNMSTGHKASVRTGIPDATWRQFYQGVAPVKTQRSQVVDTCAILESRTEIDKAECDLNGNSAAFRLSEARGILEGINQQFAQAIFYSSTASNPERINGLAPRFNSLSPAVAASAANVINAGGVGSDNTSIWLVGWGQNTVTGIFPKGSKAGLQHEDLGVIDAFDPNNNRFRAYSDLWQWQCGLHVKDWRYVVRIANIDVSNLVNETGAADLVKLMVRALARIPTGNLGKPVFYANKTVKEMLSMQALNKSQNALGIAEALRQFGGVTAGVPELRFLGYPVRTVDQILTTETLVS